MSEILPSLFVSHGTPMLALNPDDPIAESLREFARIEHLHERVRAVIAVSAHYLAEDSVIEIGADSKNAIQHDFHGFPGELYRVDYPCPGSPEVAARAASLLAEAGFQTELTTGRRLDHGIWVPLQILFPNADVPVVQVALPHAKGPREALKLGKALAPLRSEGVLLMGSGGAVHNLGMLRWEGKHGEAAPWAREFDEWLKSRLATKDVESLVEFEDAAPHAKSAHPTTEHLLPLLFTVGTARKGDSAVGIHEGIEYHSLSMFSFAMRGSKIEGT